MNLPNAAVTRIGNHMRGKMNIDPVAQMFDYVVGQLDIMLTTHKEDPDGANIQQYTAALEQVMDILDPFV